jgi:hypothetical protein
VGHPHRVHSIDQAACAWLIRRHLDPHALFVFVTDPPTVQRVARDRLTPDRLHTAPPPTPSRGSGPTGGLAGGGRVERRTGCGSRRVGSVCRECTDHVLIYSHIAPPPPRRGGALPAMRPCAFNPQPEIEDEGVQVSGATRTIPPYPPVFDLDVLLA